MNIQKSILDEAVRIYFANGDWKAYIKQAVKGQMREESGKTKDLATVKRDKENKSGEFNERLS